jgi:hypothetical protein
MVDVWFVNRSREFAPARQTDIQSDVVSCPWGQAITDYLNNPDPPSQLEDRVLFNGLTMPISSRFPMRYTVAKRQP